MSVEIRDVYDEERGCGWRKPGGLYLMGGAPARRCGRLPIPLERCPTCDAGIKPTRGWTWVDTAALVAPTTCREDPASLGCRTCPLGGRLESIGRAGLLWIGEAFYADPGAFMGEAARLGISRRIAAVPKGFTVGETWVLLAHRKTVIHYDSRPSVPLERWTYTPGIFEAFRPQAIEYVVKGQESEAELAQLAERGLTLVRVHRREPVQEEAAL